MAWHVYILQCADGRLYTGITTDMSRRLKEHQQGKGARFTRSFGAVKLLYTRPCRTHGAALSREAVIKCLSRAQKIALVTGKIRFVRGGMV